MYHVSVERYMNGHMMCIISCVSVSIYYVIGKCPITRQTMEEINIGNYMYILKLSSSSVLPIKNFKRNLTAIS